MLSPSLDRGFWGLQTAGCRVMSFHPGTFQAVDIQRETGKSPNVPCFEGIATLTRSAGLPCNVPGARYKGLYHVRVRFKQTKVEQIRITPATPRFTHCCKNTRNGPRPRQPVRATFPRTFDFRTFGLRQNCSRASQIGTAQAAARQRSTRVTRVSACTVSLVARQSMGYTIPQRPKPRHRCRGIQVEVTAAVTSREQP